MSEVTEFLNEHLIEHIVKIHSENVFLLIFRTPDDRVSPLLGELARLGIGRTFGRVDVLPMDASKPFIRSDRRSRGRKNRLTIEEILAGVQSITELTFDFHMFLISASVIAAAGLAANSVVSVVASMLVSPLMGPILGFSFGCVIYDIPLIARGFRNEIIALFITFLIGFICGFVFLYWGDSLGFPTFEMEQRGQTDALLFGIMVATASGIAVAISVTAGAVNSLVGVAISASLLPPAVNAGMLLNWGLFGPLVHNGAEVDRGLMLQYSGVSMALTIINIVCIIISANVTFLIKAIAPIEDRSNYYSEIKNLREEGLDYNFDRAFNDEQKEMLSRLHSGSHLSNASVQPRHQPQALGAIAGVDAFNHPLGLEPEIRTSADELNHDAVDDLSGSDDGKES